MLRVLVVDDDLGTRETCGIVLRHAGYEVALADSGGAAIAVLSRDSAVHALLLDLRLGDVTGYDVLRWMRGRPLTVPTAVMTAYRAEFTPDQAIALGALAYADQPLSIDDILALVRTLTEPPASTDDPLRLHARCVAKEPGALDVLAGVLLKRITPCLERAFPLVPWDYAADAATDAVVEYALNPARFDPSRGVSIVDFVSLIGRRRLANRLRAEAARTRRETRWVAAQPPGAVPGFGDPRSDIDLWAAIMEVTIDPRERRAAEAWLDGGRHEAIAIALGAGHLPGAQQRREARRFKDRLVKRLSRYVRLGYT